MKAHETSELATRPIDIELLFPDHPLLKRFEDFQQQIERRAYEIFKASGFTDGHDLDDWLKAESEFLHPAPLNIEEHDSEYVVRVEVPGFQEKEIEVAADADRVIISAQHTATSEHKKGKTARTEQESRSICRSFFVPSSIDPHKVSKHLRDGVLEIRLPKATAEKAKAAAA
jgi:HSP20 family protein